MQKVLIYRGYGASVDTTEALFAWFESNLPNYNVIYTDASSIVDNNVLDDADVKAFVMPGGQSRAFKRCLEGAGDSKITSFLEKGGKYYGFCAGGYYPCETIDFTGENFSILKKNSNAVYFNGVAKGSIPELAEGNFYGEDFSSAAVASLKFEGGDADLYYHGGPRFIGEFNSSSCKVLATYNDVKNADNAAVIKCKVGEGFALLSGVHPEVGSKYINARIYDRMSHREKAEIIRDKLQATKKSRQAFAKTLLKDLM